MKSDLSLSLIIFWVVVITGIIGLVSYDNFQFLSSIPLSNASFTKNIVLKRAFNLDSFKDAAGVDVVKYNNHYYPAYPPGYSFLAVIPYGVLQVFNWVWVRVFPPLNGVISLYLESLALTLPSILSLALISYLLYKLLRFYKLPQNLSAFVAWSLAFTTFLLGYLPSAFFHLPAALFLFAGFYLLVTKAVFSWETSLLIGLCLGMVVITEYVPALCFVPIGIAFFIKSRSFTKSVVCTLGFLVGLSILGVYNLALFGSPLHFGEMWAGTAANSAEVTSYGITFSGSPLEALYGNFLSPVKGLITNAPLTLLLPLGLFIFVKKRRWEALVPLFFAMIIAGVYSLWHDWGGGWSLGPRFYTSLMPFFFIMVAFAVDYLWQHGLGQVVVTLLAFAGMVVGFGSLLAGPRLIVPRAVGYGGLVALQRLARIPLIVSEGSTNTQNVASFIIQKSTELPVISKLSFLELFLVYYFLLFFVIAGSLFLLLRQENDPSNYEH